jgi:hypothetical protein
MHLSNDHSKKGDGPDNNGLKVGSSPSFLASSQDRDQDAIDGGEAGNHTHHWCNPNFAVATDAADTNGGVGGV